MVNFKHFVPSNSPDKNTRALNSNLIRWSYQLKAYLTQQIVDIGTAIGLNARGIVEVNYKANQLLDSIVTVKSTKQVAIVQSTGNVAYTQTDELD